MKRKFVSVIALSLVLMLLFTACGQRKQDFPQESTPPVTSEEIPEETKEEEVAVVEEGDFLREFTKANKQLQSVRLSMRSEHIFFDVSGIIMIEGLYQYDPETRENIAYHMAQVTQSSEQNGSSEIVYEKPGPAFGRNSDSEWEEVKPEEDRIDYDGFVGIVQKVLLEENFGWKKETEGDYEILVNNKDFDLIGTFKGEMNYSLEGVDQKDVDKEVIFLIDKDTLFIKEISVSMKHDNVNGKKLNTISKITFSEHNEVDEEAISKVFKEAKK